MPKILIDGRLLDDQHSGISRYTEQLINAASRKWGYENILVLVNPSLISRSFNSIETALKPFNVTDFFRFARLLKRIEFDILISPFYTNSFFKKTHTYYALVVHDLMYTLVPAFFSTNVLVNKSAVWYYDFLIKRSLKHADEVICVSQTTRQDVLKYFKKESVVFGEGINLLNLSKNTEGKSILEKFHLEKDNYFLYVGLDRPHKNLDFLIQCFKQAHTSKKLVICGKLKRNLNTVNVIQAGFVSDAELITLYANSSAFVFPSKYEGFGLPVLEALALGAKVLSSDRGALKEFDSKFVHFFNPNDENSLIHLLETVDSISVNTDNLKTYLAQYNWEKMADSLMEYLDSRFCINNIQK